LRAVYEAIETPRLRLRTMGPAFLRASIAGDRPGAERHLGLALPDDWPDEPDVLKLRLGQIEAQPGWEPWLTRLIELRDEKRVIGVIGCHGPPGGEWLRELAPGGVEFGYTVVPEWRRQGIAREASEALMAWATRTAGVTTFALSISPGNHASASLARRLGFSKVGSWQHEVRGVEHVYRRDIRDVGHEPPC
jgi:[ribosomal protein S5]-alanine N-acetyltransferase